MKIGIIGGAGLLGSALARELQKNHQIIIFSRQPIQISGLECRNMVDPEFSLLTDLDMIVNLAGEAITGVRWTDEYKKRISDSRSGYTSKLVQELSKLEKKITLINASAIGFYGSLPGDSPSFTEENPSGDDFLGKLCLEWENAALAAESYGHKVALLRIGIVLAKEGGALPKMAFPIKTFMGGEIGSGKQMLSWIHIQDFVGAIEFIINQKEAGPWNITAPQPVNNSDFTKLLGKILRRPTLVPAPGIILKLLYADGAEVLLSGQKVLPARLEKAGFKFKFANLEKALHDLLD